MANNSLLSAIVSKFAGDAQLIAFVSDGLWVGEVPEEFVPPMVAMTHLGEVPQWTTDRQYYEMGNVEFVVISNDLDVTEAITQRVKDVFDQDPDKQESEISTPEYPIVLFRRTNYLVSRQGQRTRQGQPVFSITIPYESMTDKTLPARA